MRISLAPPSVRAEGRASARRASFAKSYRPVDRRFVAKSMLVALLVQTRLPVLSPPQWRLSPQWRAASLTLASATSLSGPGNG